MTREQIKAMAVDLAYDTASDTIEAALLSVWNECVGELKEREPRCGCYTPPDYEGCTCGNYDDAHSQGYTQGWNDAVKRIRALRLEE